MPELVFFSGTMDCGKSTDLPGYAPSLHGVVDGAVAHDHGFVGFGFTCCLPSGKVPIR
ncbi:hypothetical protein ACGFS9_00490 [Streptomyces sp. NPDC048566]|uniref:hypothetical protein n=1 Tax=Streptomyces sp. NPDC048566 TaxID=3365569 RepID=UPI003712EB51